MPISYPRNVTPGTKYVLFRISTGEVINNKTDYPRTDGGEIVGLDPDLVYLERISSVIPDFDSRYYILTKTETPNVDDGIWNIAYGTQKRGQTEIEISATNVEATNNALLVPSETQLKLIILGLGVLFRQLDAQTLTAKEVVIRDKVIEVATNFWQNDANLRNKITLIAAGNEVDLDDGYVAPPPPPDPGP